jgi:RND family efflux transporter MFP subunit
MSDERSPVTQRRSWSRGLISAVLVILLLIVGGMTSSYLASLKPKPVLKTPTPRTYNVESFVVSRANVQEILRGFGTAKADREVMVSAQVSGELIELHPRLRVGERLEAPPLPSSASGTADAAYTRFNGEVIGRIDPRTYQERVIQIQNRIVETRTELDRIEQEQRNLARLVAQAQADVEDAKLELKKLSDLQQRSIATESDVRRSQMDLRKFETLLVQNQNEQDLVPVRRLQVGQRLETLQNELKLAELDLERTTIRAPFPGMLSQVNIELGQFVKPGDPLVQLIEPQLVEVAVSLTLAEHQRLVAHAQAGQRLPVELAPHESAQSMWTGEVRRWSPVADERTRTVTVYIRVDNREQSTPLLPGTFVQARIAGPILTDVMILPRDAVVSGKGFVAENGIARSRTVSVRRTLQGLAIVDEGFSVGEQVILSNLDVLYDGAVVDVQSRRTLPEELQGLVSPNVRLLPEMADAGADGR